MAFTKGIRITRDFILERIREEAIFERYFGAVIFGIDVVNHTREDDSPGCRYYIQKKTGRIRFKDFSHGYNWDCFEAAQHSGPTKGLNFSSLIRYIAKDFNLLNGKTSDNQLLEVKKSYEDRLELANNIIYKKFEFVGLSKRMNWHQRKFWDKIGVTEEVLREYYVYSFVSIRIIRFYADGTNDSVPIYSTRKELKFAYYLGEKEWKLYFPERNKKTSVKFFQFRADIMQGWYLLPDFGDYVVITKSYKDVIALGVMSIPAIAPSSESVPISKEIIQELEKRFTRTFILYDNDYPGMRATVKNLKEHENLIPILFAKGQPKDVTDNIMKYDFESVQELMLSLVT